MYYLCIYEACNLQIFDFSFCFTLGVLVKPNPLFPIAGGYIEGPIRYLGDTGAVLALLLIINTAGYCLSTQCCCLAYRFAVLQNSQWWMNLVLSWKSWVYGYLISAFVSAVSVFIFARLQPSQERVRELLTADCQILGLPLPNFNGTVILYVDYRSEYGLAAGVFITVGFFIAEVVSLGFVFVLLRMLEAKKESFSKITYKLHRQLTIALGVQLLTPFLFIVLPVSYGVIQIFRWKLSLDAGRMIINFIELYGCSNSLVTLYFIKPYRDFLLSKIRAFIQFVSVGRLCKEVPIVMVSAPESTVISALM
ncbi:unnamed protein product [Bursaphelenchus xylophilus]|uniref:(pine wood nematode) hypothetical protein n=1 Tax=Bursaphelenchus xylophilus TaxID=6326 RepID=A0A1I7RZH0_BURXY|nr:unnamed protein product [Bursaphelenchus xylophilus]CAG9106398.1 unnamed protein product [Bursaphelenchus xylophilus]